MLLLLNLSKEWETLHHATGHLFIFANFNILRMLFYNENIFNLYYVSGGMGTTSFSDSVLPVRFPVSPVVLLSEIYPRS